MELDIFERTRRRLAIGKDFPPEMVLELCRAYDAQIAQLKAVEHGVHPTGSNVCKICGFPGGYHDFSKHHPQPASG